MRPRGPRLLPLLPMSANLLALIRRARGRPIARSKAYYHRWFAVVRYEMLHDFCQVWGGPAGDCSWFRARQHSYASPAAYGVILRNHSLGPERLRASKAFLYKATVQRLRDLEAQLMTFKVVRQAGRIGRELAG